MFTTNKSAHLSVVTTNIIHNVELSDLLNGTYETTEIPICPTQAISADDNVIYTDICIACGICKKLIPESIEYSPNREDADKFTDYCGSHKMFIYRWLTLSSYDLSGTEIFIKGFSRNKRVPFVGIAQGIVRFTKCADDVKALGKVQADLRDMVNLTQSIVASPMIESSIVLIKEPVNQKERDYLETLTENPIFTLAELYYRLINHLL